MNAILKFVMSFLAKKSGKAGITTIPKASGLNVELTAKQIQKTLENMGVDVSKIKSTKEVQKYLNIHQSWLKQTQGPTIGGHRVIDATSSEGKGITEKLFGKKGEVIKVDFDPGGKQTFKGMSEGVEDVSFKPGMDSKGKIVVESPSQIIARMKKMTPMDAMAEANSVIGRKGKYKKLTPEESKKILKDTEDHIFQRDVPIDPEDLAGGGVAGGGRTSTGLNYLLGEDDQNVRVPYGEGSSWEQFQKEKTYRLWQEYQQYLKNKEQEKKQGPYIEERMGRGPGPILEAAQGGRIGLKKGTKFDPKRRTILKGIAALATLPVVGKYFKFLKPLAKSSKVLTSASEITQPSYLGSLIEVIKAKGAIKEVGKKGHKITEYKGVHLEEGPGIKTISKKSKNKETLQEIHEGEEIVKDQGLDTQKVVRSEDEYFGATTKSGKTTESISTKDHKELEKIADEIRNMVPDADEWVQPIRFDKASGGLAGMLGE